MGIEQRITAAEMKAYDGVFAAPLSREVLAAIAKLVDRELPEDPSTTPCPAVSAGYLIERYQRCSSNAAIVCPWSTTLR